MGRKKAHTPEEIVAKLRQVEVLAAQGVAVAEAVRSLGVTEQAARRAAAGGDLQHAPRGAGADRAMAPALQHGAAALLARLPPARTGGGDAGAADAADPPRFSGRGPATRGHAPLKSCPDHPM